MISDIDNMLTHTSELAIKTLMFLAADRTRKPISPRRIAGVLGCSASYLAKTTRALTRTGILRSVRGTSGGVLLAKRTEEIRLLEIVEACQGRLLRNYCSHTGGEGDSVCGFHAAMLELHDSVVHVLNGWTLRDLLERPAKDSPDGAPVECKMFFQGCEAHFPIRGEDICEDDQ